MVITPSPSNPNPVDISTPGSISYTAQAEGVTSFPTPPPLSSISWVCETQSDDPCPLVDALIHPGTPTITFDTQTLSVDTYTLVATAQIGGSNFSRDLTTAKVVFTTTDSGGN